MIVWWDLNYSILRTNEVVTDQEGPVKFIIWTLFEPSADIQWPRLQFHQCRRWNVNKWLASKISSSGNRLISLRTSPNSLLEMAKTRQNSRQLLLCKATSWTYERMYVPSLKSVISRSPWFCYSSNCCAHSGCGAWALRRQQILWCLQTWSSGDVAFTLKGCTGACIEFSL